MQLPNPILVDTQESEVMLKLLEEAGIPYSPETLPVGDYQIGKVIVEFKEIRDLINSVRTGRLWYQMRTLKEAEEDGYLPLLVICGSIYYSSVKPIYALWSQIMGLRLTLLSYGIPSIQVNSRQEFVALLKLLFSKRPEKAERPRVSRLKAKSRLTVEEIREDMLRTIPGIGSKTAQALLNKYTTPFALIEAGKDKETLANILSERTYRIFKEVVYGERV